MRRLIRWWNDNWNERQTSDRERALAQLVEAMEEQVESLKSQLTTVSSERDICKLECDLLLAVQARNLERVKSETQILGKHFATLEDSDAE